MNFVEMIKTMAQGISNAAEAAEVSKLIALLEDEVDIKDMHIASALAVYMGTIDQSSPSYDAQMRIATACMRGLGKRTADNVGRIIGDACKGNTELFSNVEAAKAMSNFELAYSVMQNHKAQREARMEERSVKFRSRFNAMGKGGKTGTGGTEGLVKVGNLMVAQSEDPNNNQKTPVFTEGLAKDIIKAPVATFVPLTGDKEVDGIIQAFSGLEPMIKINGEYRPVKSMYQGRNDDDGTNNSYYDSPFYVKKGKKYTRRDLHEKITAFLEQDEAKRNCPALFSDGKEQAPANTTIDYDPIFNSYKLLPMPLDYPVGYDVANDIAATVTLTGLAPGQKVNVSIDVEDKKQGGTPAASTSNASDDKKAKRTTVTPKSGAPYEGAICTKCNLGTKINKLKTYAMPVVGTLTAQAANALADNIKWEGYEMCGACHNKLEQAARKTQRILAEITALENQALEKMEEHEKIQAELTAANNELKLKQDAINTMEGGSFPASVIEDMKRSMEHYRFNTVGALHKKADNIESQTVAIEGNIKRKSEEAGIATVSDTDKSTKEAAPTDDKAPAADTAAKADTKKDGTADKAAQASAKQQAANKNIQNTKLFNGVGGNKPVQPKLTKKQRAALRKQQNAHQNRR